LTDAQQLLKRPNEVNEILALEQPKAWGDVEQVRLELAKRLPEAQAMEIKNRVVATVWARRMTEKEARALLDQERERQENVQRSHRQLAIAASIAAIVVSALWLTVMTALNVARRRSEIGLLAALGLPASQVCKVFFARVLLAAILGILIGALPWLLRPSLAHSGQPSVWLLAAIMAALPAMLTAALITYRQIIGRDPADVLKNES
jgi:predicted lysophospholipase L1 biosynthesis ABC-type transport system permease subunit